MSDNLDCYYVKFLYCCNLLKKKTLLVIVYPKFAVDNFPDFFF